MPCSTCEFSTIRATMTVSASNYLTIRDEPIDPPSLRVARNTRHMMNVAKAGDSLSPGLRNSPQKTLTFSCHVTNVRTVCSGVRLGTFFHWSAGSLFQLTWLLFSGASLGGIRLRKGFALRHRASGLGGL